MLALGEKPLRAMSEHYPVVFIVVLNWDAWRMTEECLKSLAKQSTPHKILVVDNGSIDGSTELIEKKYPKVHLIKESINHGFAGGVNIGIKYALSEGADMIALFNNDATADKDWLTHLVKTLSSDKELGAVGGKLLRQGGDLIDSTGDQYSIWGLPIARQRNKKSVKAINSSGKVFGATAGACLYKADMLKDVGYFDEKFFAYYEDTDFNFRMQLKGWEVAYEPRAIAYHKIGGTSGKISGFTTMQTMKNLPILFFKDVPIRLMPVMLPRFTLAYYLIFFNSLLKKSRRWPAIKGHFLWLKNIPYTIKARREVQAGKKVRDNYIRSILFNDLPPDADRLRRFRSFFTFGTR